MELKDLKLILDELKYNGKKLPIRYSHYEEGKVPPLPYLLYYVSGRDDLIADNINYIPRQNIEVELYSKNTEFALLGEIEKKLNENKIVATIIPFQYINEEKFFMTRLSFKI